MPKHSESDTQDWWEQQRDRVIGLGERSFHKSYYPELRRSLSRLERFRALLDYSGEMVLLVSLPGGQIVDANVTAAEVLGCSVSRLVGRRLNSLGLAPADSILETLAADVASRDNPARECHVALSSGERIIPIDLVYRVATLEGESYGILLGRDATHRIAAEARLRLAARVFADSGEAIMVADSRGCIVEVNRAFEQITGYDRDEVMGRSVSFLSRRGNDPKRFQHVLQALQRDDYWQGEFWSERKNEEVYPAWLSLSVIRDETGRVGHFVAMFSDITRDKANEARIEYMAHHDFLTGLPNRFLLNDRIAQLLVGSKRTGARFGVLFIDLDRFKNVNDTLGHKVGDRLLCQVATRLSDLLRPTDTVSRQGGDEFIVLLSEIENPAGAAHIATRLLQVLGEPFVIDGHELTITPSIGIAVGPDDGEDIDTLLKHADLAMYQVKQQGRNGCQFFRPEMTVRMVELLQLERNLRLALKRSEFHLCYQPQVDLPSGRVVAVEALIRWHQPERGLVAPVDFIPVAEETRLIQAIGEWVLREACRQTAEWRRRGFADLRVAVNLSAVQFQQGDLPDIVRSALVDHGLEPEALELEVTESLLMQDSPANIDKLRAFQTMGVAVAIDDFGTGYSSLAYLKQFPVNRLKIDRSFVRDLTDDGGDKAICAAIIGLASNLNLAVVAEGVETRDQLDWLCEAGCDVAQGYFLGRPMNADDCSLWMSTGREAWFTGPASGP